MPHISDIYASQMEALGKGHPLWYPDGSKHTASIEIGDVGYFHSGVFTRMFNACQSNADQDPCHGSLSHLPADHKPLEYDKDIDIYTIESDLRADVYSVQNHRRSQVAVSGAA